jgi:hypothetical protein
MTFPALPRVSRPFVAVCRWREIAVLRLISGLCVAMVGMETLTDDIFWLDWDDDALL